MAPATSVTCSFSRPDPSGVPPNVGRRAPTGPPPPALALGGSPPPAADDRRPGGEVAKSRRIGWSPALAAVAVVCGGLAVPAAAGAGATQAPRVAVPGPSGLHGSADNAPWRARNWSGYAITATTYTSVSGSWTVPTVNPPVKRHDRQFSSTWVGIDGFNDDDLIQAGTEQDWLGGSAFYQAWWEILPADEQPISGISVHPGDLMTVTITRGANWTISVTDVTRGQSFSTVRPYSGSGASAEWIQEAPTVGDHIASLAHDSTVDFTNATANGANPDLTTADAGVMTRGGRHGRIISIPSVPDAAGNGFAVAFGDVPPNPPG